MKLLVLPTLTMITVAMLATGCVQAPPPDSPTAVWTAPDDAQKPDKVWEEVRAAAAKDLSKPLSLFDIADLALQNNAATSKAWNEARAASEQVRYAQGYFMPSITAGYGVNRNITEANPDSFNQDKLNYGPSLHLSYLVCNFGGGRSAAVEQALQTVYASNFAFNRAIQDTLLAAETAYYKVISAQAGVEAATTNVLDAKVILEAATERRKAGVGVELDVLQAQSLYDQALYNLASVEGLLKIGLGQLAATVGFPADTPLQLQPPSSNLPGSLSEPDMRRLTDDALARRPDLAALRASLAAREASIKVAKATRWPSLFLDGSVAQNNYERYGSSEREAAADELAYMGGVSLRWNLFDGLQTLSTIRSAEAQAEATRAQLKQAELAASAEIWGRFQNYETALRLYDSSLSAYKSATASQQLAMESYNAGIKSILDVLNSETQLAQARRQQIVARHEVFTALADLAHATGVIEKGGSLKAREHLGK